MKNIFKFVVKLLFIFTFNFNNFFSGNHQNYTKISKTIEKLENIPLKNPVFLKKKENDCLSIDFDKKNGIFNLKFSFFKFKNNIFDEVFILNIQIKDSDDLENGIIYYESLKLDPKKLSLETQKINIIEKNKITKIFQNIRGQGNFLDDRNDLEKFIGVFVKKIPIMPKNDDGSPEQMDPISDSDFNIGNIDCSSKFLTKEKNLDLISKSYIVENNKNNTQITCDKKFENNFNLIFTNLSKQLKINGLHLNEIFFNINNNKCISVRASVQTNIIIFNFLLSKLDKDFAMKSCDILTLQFTENKILLFFGKESNGKTTSTMNRIEKKTLINDLTLEFKDNKIFEPIFTNIKLMGDITKDNPGSTNFIKLNNSKAIESLSNHFEKNFPKIDDLETQENLIATSAIQFIAEEIPSNGTNSGQSSNGTNTGQSSNGTNTGQGSNGTNSGQGSNGTNTGQGSNGINTGQGSNGINTGQKNQPKDNNFGYILPIVLFIVFGCFSYFLYKNISFTPSSNNQESKTQKKVLDKFKSIPKNVSYYGQAPGAA